MNVNLRVRTRLYDEHVVLLINRLLSEAADLVKRLHDAGLLLEACIAPGADVTLSADETKRQESVLAVLERRERA